MTRNIKQTLPPELYEKIKSGVLCRAWELSWLLLQSQLPAHTFPSLLPTFTASLSWQIAYFPSSTDSCYCRRQHSIKLLIKGGKELPPFNSSWTLGENKYSPSFLLCEQWHGTSENTGLSARCAEVLKEINSEHAISILCSTECIFPASYTNSTTFCSSQKGEVGPGYQLYWILIWAPPLIEEEQSFLSFKSDQLSPQNCYAHKDCLEKQKSFLQFFPIQHVHFATLPQQKQEDSQQRIWRYDKRKDRRRIDKGAGQWYGTTVKLKHRSPVWDKVCSRSEVTAKIQGVISILC